MLEDLLNIEAWNGFLSCKLDNSYIVQKEKKSIMSFICGQQYLPICEGIVAGTYEFSIPAKHLIAKNASGKKRTVYSFPDDEMMVLKFITYLLGKYDGLFSPNLYSFRKTTGIRNAVNTVFHMRNRRTLFGYKADISNYFNSVDVGLLLPELQKDLDADVFALMSRLLTDDRAIFRGELMHEMKGAMAGVPFSPFIANYYLKDMDRHFLDEHVMYLRYADDILLFANTKEELDDAVDYLHRFLESKHLHMNPEKEKFISPGENFDFLGFSFKDRVIDLSAHSVEKIKGKIRRKARALRRWYLKKGLPADKALVAMNKAFNTKFYGKTREELSWEYWYFPHINTAESLKVVDAYMQQMQRYIVTGRHNKMNYKRCDYEHLKQCGYRSLVAEYYAFRKSVENEGRDVK